MISRRWFWLAAFAALFCLLVIGFSVHHRSRQGGDTESSAPVRGHVVSGQKQLGRSITGIPASERVRKSWERWKSAATKLNPNLIPPERPGASDEEITALGETLGVSLPKEFREFLKIFPGGVPSEDFSEFETFWEGSQLMNCELIAEDTQSLRDAWEPPSKPVDQVTSDEWWHPKHLILVSDMDGGGLAIDCQTGNVWDWDHDGGLFGIIAPSWGALLELMAEAIENGTHDEYEPGDLLFYNLPKFKVAYGVE